MIMENITKALLLVAATLITVLTVSVGFFWSRQSKAINNEVNYSSAVEDYYGDITKTIYQDMPVTGTKVIDVLKSFSKDYTLGVRVINKYSDVYYGASFHEVAFNAFEFDEVNTAETYKLSYTVADDEYINPYAEFVGSIQRDLNGNIIGITFEIIQV